MEPSDWLDTWPAVRCIRHTPCSTLVSCDHNTRSHGHKTHSPLSCILCPQGLTAVTMTMPHLQTSQPIPMRKEVTIHIGDMTCVVIKQFSQATGYRSTTFHTPSTAHQNNESWIKYLLQILDHNTFNQSPTFMIIAYDYGEFFSASSWLFY